ncbi:hypothetical protein F4809DRAFT_121807 [Biscogniauxia mediterranea]|nr:hypothetical protein F4809DRAFT_121807 [Biscogniauxia mediterranea]
MSLVRANCLRLAHRLKPPCAALPRTIQTHQQHLYPRRYSSDNGSKKPTKPPPKVVRRVKNRDLNDMESEFRRREEELERREKELATLEALAMRELELARWERQTGIEKTKTPEEEEEKEDNPFSFANPGPITPPRRSPPPPPLFEPPAPPEPASKHLNREQRRWQKKVEKHRAALRAHYHVPEGEPSARVDAEVAAWEAAQALSSKLRDARMVGKRTAAARRAMERKGGGDRRTRRDFVRILASAHRVMRKASRYVAEHGTREEVEAWEREIQESGWLIDVEPLPGTATTPAGEGEEGEEDKDVGYGDEIESEEDMEMEGEEEVDREVEMDDEVEVDDEAGEKRREEIRKKAASSPDSFSLFNSRRKSQQPPGE